MDLDRRQFLAATAAVPMLAGQTVPPSYLLIVPDQLTWWMCDPAQRGALDLPNIDRLRAEGTNFDRCYATSPVCSASRVSLRTGLWPHANPGNIKLAHPITTVEEHMQQGGYKTQYLGKWHLSPVPLGQFVQPDDRPHWDQFVGHESSHTLNETYVMDDPTPVSTAPWDSAAITGFALRMLESNDRSAQPFFMQVDYLPPHNPYGFYPSSLAFYKQAQGTLRPNSTFALGNPPKFLSQYMNLVRGVDIEVGRLLRAVDEMSQDVVVIFFSDHGDMLGSQGMNLKRKPFEEAARVPLIVRGPGWAAETVSHPVGLVDLAQTLCGLGQGRDIRQYRDSVYYEMIQTAGSWEGGHWRALVTDDGWKLAISEHGPRLLYDLFGDPYELINQAGVGFAHESRLERMMLAWAEETGDDFFR